MRALAVLIFVLISIPSAHAEYWDGDRFLECLVGKGAVEIRHGVTAETALAVVRDPCMETLEPDPSEEPEGDSGDYVDYLYGAALTALTAIEAASPF